MYLSFARYFIAAIIFHGFESFGSFFNTVKAVAEFRRVDRFSGGIRTGFL